MRVVCSILVCLTLLAASPNGAQTDEFVELRRMLAEADLSGAQAEIERLAPGHSQDPEFRTLQVQTLRQAARIALQKERSEDAVLLYRQAEQLEAAPIRQAIQAKHWKIALVSIERLQKRDGLTPQTRLLLAEYWIARGDDSAAKGARGEAIQAYRSASQYWPDNAELEARIQGLAAQQSAPARESVAPALPAANSASAYPYAAGGALPQMGTKSYFILDAEATARLIESLTSPDGNPRGGLADWASDFRPREIVLLVLLALANIQLGLLLLRRLSR